MQPTNKQVREWLGFNLLKGGEMGANLNLPVIENENAAKYNFPTKLIPVFVDGVLVAYEQVHVNSARTEVRRDSLDAIRAAGFRVPHVDYCPIVEQRGIYG